jgi:hypothetical protein
MTTLDQQSAAGAAIYNQTVLSVYDLFVLGFSNQFAWRCSSNHILDFYNQHISNNHLDVGIGTGYFLDHCRFSSNTPRLAVMDLNPNSLKMAKERLRRYQPTTYQADILAPLSPAIKDFNSIGLNYVLHCLPGTMAGKGIVFEHLKACLSTDGVFFGSTILGQGVQHNALGQFLMKTYNKKGIFSNDQDNRADLEDHLKKYFRKYTLEITGCVACFVGWV